MGSIVLRQLAAAFAVLLAASACGVVQAATGPVQAAAPSCLPPEPARTSGRAPIAVYGGMPATDQVEISPGGRHLAYVAIVGEQRSLIVCDMATLTLIGGVRAGDVKVRGLTWINDDYVMLTSSATQSSNMTGLQRQELFEGQIYSLATRRVAKVFTATSGVFPRLGRVYVRNGGLIAEGSFFQGPAYKGEGLYRINLDTGRGETALEDPAYAGGYMLNAAGEPVSRIQYDAQSKIWIIQRAVGAGWREVWRVTAPIDAPSVAGFGRTDRELVVQGGQDSRPDEFKILNLDTGEWSPLPFEGEPSGILSHPSTGLLIGAATQGDGETTIQFSDPDAQRAWNTVKAAYRGKRSSIVSWSGDLKILVVRTEGPGDPGTYQIVDMNRRTAEIFGETYPLAPEQVGEIRVVSYPAADGMRIPGYLTLPPGVTDPKGLPLVVLPHGGPQSRDTLGFDWWAQGMASRGYAVLQPNYRGSDGLGMAHLEAGYGQWGLKMQTDLSDGVRWLASEGIVDPARVCIVGASYGGYAAMAGPTLDNGVYRCAVAVAGVSDLRAMVQWSAENGRRDGPVVQYWNRFMGAERLGDRSLDERSPARQAARSDAPMLLIHGRDDTVVPYRQSVMLAEALRAAGKPVEFIEMNGEDHWLSRADTRTRMLAETVRFLETHNPPR